MEYSIRIRKRLLPRTFTDFSAMVFMSFAIPAVYWFEVYIVAPTVYNRVLNILHTILGTYVVINIIGNFLAIIAVDTSTQGLLLPSQVPPGWHVCATCESTAPPRSRHCITCNVCVLKKEHHCVFAGCCVGLRNHRYFYIFLFLMWGSTLYCSFLNAFFIWPYVGGFNLWAMVRLMLPGIWLVLEPSMDTLFAFLFSINCIGFLFMTVLMYYYTGLLVTNTTTRENNERKTQKYDYGREQNIKVTLVVNVASRCGYTERTYRELKKLHDILSFGGYFSVLAFPCNQFGDQEPQDMPEIIEYVTSEFDVEFPIFNKISVIGEHADSAFKMLVEESSVVPDWNFYKYLVDETGHVVKAWGTRISIEEIFDEVQAAVDKAKQVAKSRDNKSAAPETADSDVKDEL